ncbi:inner membrane protein [Escherichia coli]|nr:inner membrane protein [Escherichia coli]
METFNSLFMVSPLLLGVLFFVAMPGGIYDSIAGGGGLLTIPALMAAGCLPLMLWQPINCKPAAALFPHYLLYSPQSG